MQIIAEIGKNFVTEEKEQPIPELLENAKALIKAAKESGADVCKFQVHCVEDEIHPETSITSPHFPMDRYEWVKRNTYPVEFWIELKDYCREVGVEFLATPMSKGAAEMLDIIGVDSWKVGSGDVTDFVLLDYIRQSGKPVILSSGMSTFEELRRAYDYLSEKGCAVTVLHCVSEYPCPLEDLNLFTIPFLKKHFPKVGFSDHSLEISTGIMAKTLGAKVIEKHFTLNRNAWGPDHKVSLLPHEFKQMVKEIKEWKMDVKEIPKEALGVPTKFINEEEMKFRKVFKKGLYAARPIKAGEIFEPDSFIALRPCDQALPVPTYKELLGLTVTRAYKKYDPI